MDQRTETIRLISVACLISVLSLAACGGGGGTSNNNAPLIDSLSVTPPLEYLKPGQQITLAVTAHDPDGDALEYFWTAGDGGFDTVSGTTVVWTAPQNSSGQTVSIDVSVSDGRGGVAVSRKSVLCNIPLSNRTVFSGTPGPTVKGHPVTFVWDFSGSIGETIKCSLDVEADGIVDYFIDNCDQNRSLNHVFSSAGHFEPRFTATTQFQDVTTKYADVRIAAPIDLNIQSPVLGQKINAGLNVAVSFTSAYDVKEFRASVEGRETLLTLSGSTATGTILLDGLSQGSKHLRVVGTDVFDNTAAAYREFFYDKTPTLRVFSPVNGMVARQPSVPVSAECQDDDPAGCQLVVLVAEIVGGIPRGGNPVANGSTRIDTAVDLSAYQGKPVLMTIRARDSSDQGTEISRTIYLENSARILEVDTVGGGILDASPDRILFIETSSSSNVVKIKDRTSGLQTVVMDLGGSAAAYGYLTARGAIFSTTGPNRVYEWRDQALLDLGDISITGWLKSQGAFAIWSKYLEGNASALLLRDLSRGTTATIDNSAILPTADVAENGRVVWKSQLFGGIRVYDNGVETTLPTGSIGIISGLLTDGSNVVYSEAPKLSPYSTRLNDGSTEIILSTDSSAHFAINAGWVGFYRRGNLNQFHVWIRSPQGAESQRSFFATTSAINHLASDGEAMILNEGRRYLSGLAGTLTEIGMDYGRSMKLEGKWHIVSGASLFEVLP